jgi:ATP-dependent exoDNAse (exonuclease V) alpha subunit
LEKLIVEETQSTPETENCQCKAEYVNLLFGLYRNGFVRNDKVETLALDNLQLLSPYRAGYFGTIGLNEAFKTEYRERHWLDNLYFKSSPFDHADKIIRINNWYTRKGGRKLLILSNGSIGVINNKQQGIFRKYYFTDQEEPLTYIDSDENFELAYAITIHKSQGSDFKNVFLIIPKKATLLSKELLYTALTRSRYRVTLFLQKEKENPLETARNRSFVLSRNTSIFIEPEDYKKSIIQTRMSTFVQRQNTSFILP